MRQISAAFARSMKNAAGAENAVLLRGGDSSHSYSLQQT